jgi:hypothetical protein
MSLDKTPARPAVFYGVEPTLDAESFRRVLDESGLGSIRPTGDLVRLQAMLSAADLVVTARLDAADGPLVGVARCLTDYATMRGAAISPTSLWRGQSRACASARASSTKCGGALARKWH